MFKYSFMNEVSVLNSERNFLAIPANVNRYYIAIIKAWTWAKFYGAKSAKCPHISIISFWMPMRKVNFNTNSYLLMLFSDNKYELSGC